MAEFKEFERRFEFKPRIKYGWFHLKLYQMFQDLNRALNLNRVLADLNRCSSALNAISDQFQCVILINTNVSDCSFLHGETGVLTTKIVFSCTFLVDVVFFLLKFGCFFLLFYYELYLRIC